MDPLIAINDTVLAVIYALFSLEAGEAALYLLSYKSYRDKFSKYLSVSWEISGTFVVFYLVMLEVTYPGLLVPVGTLYSTPIILAAIFIIARNAFLAYSEYVKAPSEKVHDTKIYAATTLIAAFLFISILDSAISGFGVSLNGLSLNFLILLLNPYNICIFFAILLLAIAAVLIFFNLGSLKRTLTCILLSAALFITSFWTYNPYTFNAILSKPYYGIVSLLIFVALIVLYAKRDPKAKYLVIPWLASNSLLFQAYQYPYLFSGAINVTHFLPQQLSAYYDLVISVIGIVFLAVMVAVLLYAHRISSKKGAKRAY